MRRRLTERLRLRSREERSSRTFSRTLSQLRLDGECRPESRRSRSLSRSLSLQHERLVVNLSADIARQAHNFRHSFLRRGWNVPVPIPVPVAVAVPVPL